MTRANWFQPGTRPNERTLLDMLSKPYELTPKAILLLSGECGHEPPNHSVNAGGKYTFSYEPPYPGPRRCSILTPAEEADASEPSSLAGPGAQVGGSEAT